MVQIRYEEEDIIKGGHNLVGKILILHVKDLGSNPNASNL